MNIDEFCGKDDIRKYLNKPFNIDGRTVASNGKVLLSTALNAEHDELIEEKKPVIQKLLAGFDATKLTTMPLIPLPAPIECWTCGGGGTAHKKLCSECDGEGQVSFESDCNHYECECKSCEGDGFFVRKHGEETCFSCGGDGSRYISHEPADVLGVKVDMNYLKLIINAPDLVVFADVEAHMLWFQSGDEYGVIMGMRV